MPEVLKNPIWSNVSQIQDIEFNGFQQKKIKLSILREDLLCKEISGNKFRKLKYNLDHAVQHGFKGILTFGGAFSNHIAATAAAGQMFNVQTIGIIRGEEDLNNPTLQEARACGMHLEFVSRTDYRNKNKKEYLEQLKSKYSNVFIIPEGGDNDLGIKGCEEIIRSEMHKFDYICLPCGTASTLTGVISTSKSFVLGFSSLKNGGFLIDSVKNNLSQLNCKSNNWEILLDYHLGGYAKVTDVLFNTINQFYDETKILLDPVYTSKMIYGLDEMVHSNYFPENSKLLVIHTGGIQGWKGLEYRGVLKNRLSESLRERIFYQSL